MTQKDNDNVGIGTRARKLEINSGTADASGLRLTNLTSAGARIPASRTIGVITAGNVITVSRVSAMIPPQYINATGPGSYYPTVPTTNSYKYAWTI